MDFIPQIYYWSGNHLAVFLNIFPLANFLAEGKCYALAGTLQDRSDGFDLTATNAMSGKNL